MNGIKNFLQLLYDNWTLIVMIIAIVFTLYKRIETYKNLSKEEKITKAKFQIKETILDYISSAEDDYSEWSKVGSLKRSEVIRQIYKDYPILSLVVDQEELTKWIDELIDDSLNELRKIIEQQ